MNKRVIIGIIVLMSLALLGLVSLQVYWINTVLKLKDQEFSLEVYKALKETVQEHDRYLASETLKGMFGILGSGEHTKVIIDQDTLVLSKSITNTGIDDASGYFQLPGSGLNVESETQKRFDQMSRWYSLKMAEQEHGEQMSRLVSMVVGEVQMQMMPFEKRTNLELIENSLTQKLKQNGIHLGFEYGVVPASGDTVHSLAKVDKQGVINSDYRLGLYPSSLSMSPYYLSIYFPKKINYLLRTIQMRLMTSLVFILIIIFGFTFTIWTIFRQKKLSDMKNDFINNMTHEFKTPITTLSLAGQALADRDIVKDQDRLGRFSSIIMEETSKLGNQVEKILQMAILDKGEFKLKVKEVDMHDIIGTLVENYTLRLQDDTDAFVDARLRAHHAIIQADEVHIANLVDNLIDNAVKYCKDHPQLTITTENARGGLLISVKDNGIGMSKEAQKHIFEKFYRVPTGNVHNVKGFGLGLAYAKNVVDAHFGEITVSSEPNKGTTFSVWLPFAHEPN